VTRRPNGGTDTEANGTTEAKEKGGPTGALKKQNKNGLVYCRSKTTIKPVAHRVSISTSKETELIEQWPTGANGVERPQLGRQHTNYTG